MKLLRTVVLGFVLALISGAVADNYILKKGSSFVTFDDTTNWNAVNCYLSADQKHFREGASGLRVTVNPGSTAYARHKLNLNLSNAKTFNFWVYLALPYDPPTFHGVSLSFSPDGFRTGFVATTYSLRPGWTKIVFSKADFRNEGGASWNSTMSDMQVGVFGDNSTGFSATFDALSVDELTRPKVILSFDDDYSTTYDHAYPYMKRYGLKGSVYTISTTVGSPGYTSVSQLNEMYNYGWDICNHTATHPDMSKLTQRQAEAEIQQCADFIKAHGWTRNQGYMHLAYPHGRFSLPVLNADTALGLATARGTLPQRQANALDARYLLYTLPIDPTYSRAQVMAEVDKVISSGGVLQLNFHRLTTSRPTATIDWLQADFDAVVDYLAAKRNAGVLDVPTLTEWYNGLKPR